ncbi:MAG: WG repeat-containing protein [Bacteroidetes bacterium]|nr:WG repeat-containing protein [Bacteroidota bacterium]
MECGIDMRVHKEALFPIVENGLYGFIDSTGAVRIKPKYKSCGNFSEGTAAVRLDGLYGYINTDGEWLIPPSFEYAWPFQNGTAIVADSGVYRHIDMYGRSLYKYRFADVRYYDNGVAQSTLKSGKIVLIDEHGVVLTKAHTKIMPLRGGYYLAGNANSKSKQGAMHYYVYDTAFNVVHQFVANSQAEIWKFDDCFIVEPRNSSYTYDSEGRITSRTTECKSVKVRFTYSDNNASSFNTPIALHPQTNSDNMLIGSDRNGSRYYLLSSDGVVQAMFYNAELRYVGEDRYALSDSTNLQVLVDGKGRQLSSFKYENRHNVFHHGRMVVGINGREQVIDSNGILYHSFSSSYVEQRGEFLITTKEGINKGEPYVKGIAFLHDTTTLFSVYGGIGLNYADEGVFILYEGSTVSYAQASGKVIWQHDRNNTRSQIDIDYMNGAIYFVQGLTGSMADTIESATNKIDKDFLRGGLKLVVASNERSVGSGNIYLKGFNVIACYLANDSDSSIYFSTQDARLYMLMQAKDAAGNWQDIEYIQHSTCGNSYYNEALPKGEYWKFEVPAYTGSIKTKLRMKLDIEGDGKRVIYSNEFAGSVNPAQFWRKQGYTPSGLMDPYND